MKVKEEIFRAYDIRGIYPQEINEEIFYLIAHALGQFLRPKKFVIARDARPSSFSLAQSFKKALQEQGVKIFDIGWATTPMLYFGVNFFQADGGAMITASHNPAQYNGLKLVREKAIPIGKESGLSKIKKLVLQRKIKKIKKQGKVFLKDIKKDYINFLIPKKKINLPGKIVVDAGNGMTGIVLDEILSRLKIDYFGLYFEPDCTFPNHEANPLKEETLSDLKKKMKEKKAFLGIAFDGDGDRIAFLDEKQNVIEASLIFALLAKEILKEKKKGVVLYDLRLSKIVPETILNCGGKPVKTKVGHAFLKKEMRKFKAVFGGELSGHFYFPFYFKKGKSYFESGIFTMIKIFEIISREKKYLSQLVLPFKKYFHSKELNFQVKNKKKVIKKLAQIYKEGKISWLDGLSVEYPQWWFNVRASNTEPLLRLNLEAKNKALLFEKIKEIKNYIEKN